MNHQQHFQALVVGAGPVGMMAALELARKKIDVAIMDRDDGGTTRAYACVLHSKSFQLLEEVGIGEEALSRGIRVDRVSLSENGVRMADLLLPQREREDSFLLILPQSDLEEMLRRRLADYGITIQWRHRLTDLRADSQRVIATIDRLWDSAKGYGVPYMDLIVGKTIQRSALYLIGADGRDSHVRELLGIDAKTIGEAEYFAAYEFDLDEWPAAELHIAFTNGVANLFTRLPNGRGRWIFHCAPHELDIEAHWKDRFRFRIIDPAHDGEILKELKDRMLVCATEMGVQVGAVDWHGVVEFQDSLVTRYGINRCWLAGDAAHVASPIGMHSMNVGLLEASELAKIIADRINGTENLDLLRQFDDRMRAQWNLVLRMPDVRMRKFARALPAAGADLDELLRQVRDVSRPTAGNRARVA